MRSAAEASDRLPVPAAASAGIVRFRFPKSPLKAAFADGGRLAAVAAFAIFVLAIAAYKSRVIEDDPIPADAAVEADRAVAAPVSADATAPGARPEAPASPLMAQVASAVRQNVAGTGLETRRPVVTVAEGVGTKGTVGRRAAPLVRDTPPAVRRRGAETAAAGPSLAALASESAFVGTLVVASEPAGAEVLINGVSRGYTPVSIKDLPAGTRVVRLNLPGYTRWSWAVTVVPNRRTPLSVKLQPEGRRIGASN